MRYAKCDICGKDLSKRMKCLIMDVSPSMGKHRNTKQQTTYRLCKTHTNFLNIYLDNLKKTEEHLQLLLDQNKITEDEAMEQRYHVDASPGIHFKLTTPEEIKRQYDPYRNQK